MNKSVVINVLNNLIDRNRIVISKTGILKFLAGLNTVHFDKIVPYKIEPLGIIFKEICRNSSNEEMESIRKIVILKSLLGSWDEIFSAKYPVSIQEQYQKTSQRIINICIGKQSGWNNHSEDVYWKDLALSRQQMFPAGAQIVEVFSGFGLMQGLRANLAQMFRFVKLLIYGGGRIGYYQIHTHTPELEEFTEQGWNDCYVRIAEMLDIYKNVKGVFGASWFYDPQLENISPRLIYLQKTPLNNGARCFYVEEDRTGNALAKSKHRYNLYKEGKYKPKKYLLVWPREALLKWARIYSRPTFERIFIHSRKT